MHLEFDYCTNNIYMLMFPFSLFRTMSMQVSTLLPMILLITSVRWPLITIQKHLIFWISVNTQVG